MKLIIDICENELTEDEIEEAKRIADDCFCGVKTIIPDNATNGDVMKMMFGVKEVDMSNTYCVHFPEEEDYSHYFFKEWWNALYQKGGK